MTMRTTGGNAVRSEGGGSGVTRGPAAGTRPARPAERRGLVRPGGRRVPSPLPAARPRVVAGTGRGGPAGAPAGRAPSVAVVRRRRLVALVLAVTAVLAAGLLLGVFSSTAEAADAGVTSVTVVRSGESLQDLARRTAPGSDEREIAGRIREMNDLPSSSVSPGRPLVVPVG